MGKILIIITGSIAAYKCLEIINLIKNSKFQISCILTEEAKKYVNIRDLRKYTSNRIFMDKSEKENRMLHIKLSRNNNLILVYPATANTIAKFANGYGDNLASNTLLASNKKIIFVPAMNSQMWANKSNINNIRLIKKRGHEIIGPEVGKLKCGEFGLGRISNSKKVLKIVKQNGKTFNLFSNKKCIVTAGPTIEMIDPIRYISNQSSGKQGYEIASQLAINGAKVVLISGPTSLDPPPNVKLVKIKTADEMYKKIKDISNVDIGIFTAAVSDFKNKKISSQKLKKKNSLNLNLIKNIDVLKKIGNNKKRRPKVLVGFAAETKGIAYAKKKLIEKNCDIIVYNRIDEYNKVFGSDFNKITLVTKTNTKDLKKMTKVNCAKKIIEYIYNYQLINE